MNLTSKRFLALMVVNVIWATTGLAAHQWEVFSSMTIPIVGLNASYFGAETLRKSGTPLKTSPEGEEGK
jgi:hypothetical protein